MKLRKFLLQGNKSRKLFFNPADQSNSNKPLTHYNISIQRIISRIDSNLKIVTPREWRAAKSDWLINNYDISTTSLILQNSEKTVLKSYSAGSHTKHVEEVGNFLEELCSKAVSIETREEKSELNDSAVGSCKEYKFPSKLDETSPINPDCKRPEGCLFCKNYIVHSDAKDIRKLLSCLYCIEHTAFLSTSIDQFNLLFESVKKRIEFILKSIGSKSDHLFQLINKTRLEVDQANKLDPYWEQKLAMLLELRSNT